MEDSVNHSCGMGIHWQFGDDGISLYLDNSGNLRCPHCGSGVFIQIKVAEDSGGQKANGHAHFRLSEAIMVCSLEDCMLTMTMRDYIEQEIFADTTEMEIDVSS